ncbi:MAG TPA: BrxE family protein [Actinomycetota bacterium]|nr:BrxE family protein [Actinomycetota bacterium]
MRAVLPDTSSTIRLTLAVARLGEADLFGWWRSRGLSEAGRFVLGNGLPRTWRLAAMEGAVLSAAARHGQVFGRPDALHLFSDELPAKRLTLSWLRERKVEGDTDGLLSELSAWSRDVALERLLQWAGPPPPAGEVLGQVRRLGSIGPAELEDEARVEEALRQLAAAYALDPGDLRYPYFDLRAP